MAECPGVYRLSQMRDGALARVRIPGGELQSTQLRIIAEIAREFGNGLVDLTNRANLQIRGLTEESAVDVAARLRQAELLCENPDADRFRNITASPLAGIDPDELVDVRNQVAELDAWLQTAALTAQASVKFAFVLDGGGRGNLRDVGHDIGFFAQKVANRPLFSVSLSGRSTQYAIPLDAVTAFTHGALSVMAENGGTRIKDLLERTDPETLCIEIAERSGIAGCVVPITPDTRPGRLPVGPDPVGMVLGVPLARLTADQIVQLAELCDHGSGTTRLTPWQSVILPEVPAEQLREAQSFGFDVADPAIHVVACTGAPGCIRTSADTKADALNLRQMLSARPEFKDGTRPTIHLSGCARGCAMPGTSDILALAQTQSANYALYAGSRPATAGLAQPDKADVSPETLGNAIDDMIG